MNYASEFYQNLKIQAINNKFNHAEFIHCPDASWVIIEVVYTHLLRPHVKNLNAIAMVCGVEDLANILIKNS